MTVYVVVKLKTCSCERQRLIHFFSASLSSDFYLQKLNRQMFQSYFHNQIQFIDHDSVSKFLSFNIKLGHRVKSGIFGQTAKFGQRPCLFHISNIGMKNRLNKQTVKIVMRRLI